MGYGDYLRQLLGPLGVYDLTPESLSGSELDAMGAGLDGCAQSVEEAETEELFAHTAHPYTKALLSAVPDISKRHEEERIVLKGDLPSPIHAPSGCVFRTRCPYATAACAEAAPDLGGIAPGHKPACHLCK